MQAKRWIAGIGAGTLLLLGGAMAVPLDTIAQATHAPGASQVAAMVRSDHDEDFTGSIPAPEKTWTNDQEETVALKPLAKITEDEAAKVATEANPGATVTSNQLETEDGYVVYAVRLSNGMELRIDAGDATVLETSEPDFVGSVPAREKAWTNKQEKTDALKPLAKINEDEAGKAATDANSGTTVTKIKLDTDEGFVVYEVDLSNGTEVTIDAGDGKILETEHDEDHGDQSQHEDHDQEDRTPEASPRA